MDTPLYRRNINDTIRAYCDCNMLPQPEVRYLPAADGDGAYSATAHRLTIGADLLAMPDWAGYYALYLLLAEMHLWVRPADFSSAARRSLRYRIRPDGRCDALQKDGSWRSVDLSKAHPAAYWRGAAANMPHLTEIAERAQEEAYDMMTNDIMRDNLHSVCYLSRPKTAFAVEQYDALFAEIDRAVADK